MAGERVRIFISSPGGVARERRRAALVVQQLNRDFGNFFAAEAYLWEHEAQLASGHFQDNIKPPSQFDIVVLILWSRLGTYLPAVYTGADGCTPVTGTEWEYEHVRAYHAKTGIPDLLVFRNRSGLAVKSGADRVKATIAGLWNRSRGLDAANFRCPASDGHTIRCYVRFSQACGRAGFSFFLLRERARQERRQYAETGSWYRACSQ